MTRIGSALNARLSALSLRAVISWQWYIMGNFGSALRLNRSHKLEKTIFEQENFYYKCKAHDGIGEQNLDKKEAEEKYSLAFVYPEEALRKNRYDDHKEKNGGIWIERESRIL